MAIVGGTVLPEKREMRAIACARPAEGPSYMKPSVEQS
jgi:hypothetical protein